MAEKCYRQHPRGGRIEVPCPPDPNASTDSPYGDLEGPALHEAMRRAGDNSYLDDLSMDDLSRDDIGYSRDQSTRDRWQEDHRQGRVDSGSNMINAHFGGGSYGTGQVDWADLPFAFNSPGIAGGLEGMSPDALDVWGSPAPTMPENRSMQSLPRLSDLLSLPGEMGDHQSYLDYRDQTEQPTQGFLDWALGGENTFYDAEGNPVTDPNQILELGPKGQLFTGSGQAENPFDDSFFAAQGDAYKDWANPQVQTQYQDANRGLTFALSGAGHSAGSSTMIDRNDRLQLNNAQAMQDIGRTADNIENQARQSIDNEKMDLLTLNQANADPSEMASLLPGRIQNASTQGQDFNPLGNAFQDVATGVGQYIHGRNMAQGYGGNMNLPPIYGGPAGSNSGRNYS